MTLTELVASAGVALQGTLALLLFVAWRALRLRWALLLASGFLMVAAQYLSIAVGHYSREEGWQAAPNVFNLLCVSAAYAFITWGLLEYVELPARPATWIKRAVLAALGVTAAALAAGLLTRAGAVTLVSLFLCGWAVLFAWAMLNEPRSGHGLVMLAVLTYPLSMAAAALGWLDRSGASMSLIIPNAVMAMTLLTTGLVRAHRAARRELRARREAQAELERANATLEQRVADRTADLAQTIAGLESFNRSVSHDLRGPLGGIAGIARLARDAAARGDADKAARLLGAIVQQADVSSDLVNALLQLARPADTPIERREVDLDLLVQEVIVELGADAATRVRVTPLPPVQGDRALLRQAFTNLVGNAVKFSGRAADPQVEVGARREASGLVIFVRDNGVGFTAEQAAGLFQPFHRLHGSAFEGTGIGLTVVRRIVERHGGQLWAQGEPGVGATFHFTLQPTP